MLISMLQNNKISRRSRLHRDYFHTSMFEKDNRTFVKLQNVLEYIGQDLIHMRMAAK